MRKAVLHAQQYDSMEQHSVALAALGAEPEDLTGTKTDEDGKA